MAKEIEMFQISIEKRQKKIHACTRYSDVFVLVQRAIFFLLISHCIIFFFKLFFPRFLSSRLFSSLLVSFSLFSLFSLYVNRTTKKLTKSMRQITRDILTLQAMVHASEKQNLFSIEHETRSHFVKLSNSVQRVVSGYETIIFSLFL